MGPGRSRGRAGPRAHDGPAVRGAREYLAGSAYHRLENVRVPILVAHGERDERVSPKQSEQLATELRELGKTFEYVTYLREAHGLLRAARSSTSTRRLNAF